MFIATRSWSKSNTDCKLSWILIQACYAYRLLIYWSLQQNQLGWNVGPVVFGKPCLRPNLCRFFLDLVCLVKKAALKFRLSLFGFKPILIIERKKWQYGCCVGLSRVSLYVPSGILFESTQSSTMGYPRVWPPSGSGFFPNTCYIFFFKSSRYFTSK